MKKKLLMLLAIASLTMFMTGCKVEAKNTDEMVYDEDYAEAVDEINAALEEEQEDSTEDYLDDEYNGGKIDLENIYIVNKNDKDTMVFQISHTVPFDGDTAIYLYGINNGEEQLIGKETAVSTVSSGFQDVVLVSNAKGLKLNIPSMMVFNDDYETTEAFLLDWDGYESYRIDVQYEEGPSAFMEVTDKYSYEIDAEDVIRVTEEEFVENKINEMMDSVESDKCENEQIIVEYKGNIIANNESTLTVSIENVGDLPITKKELQLTIMDKYNNQTSDMHNNDSYIKQLAPGEKIDITFTEKISDTLIIESGAEYMVSVCIYNPNTGESIFNSYLKSKF